MNQTKKRLSIINLAISITDIETIQLQVLKLSLLISDTKIQEIISVLQNENYAKAQRLIKVYIDTPLEEILERNSQQKKQETEELKEETLSKKTDTIISEEDQKIIDEFQLFTTSTNIPKEKKPKEINISDYLTNTYADLESETNTDNMTVDSIMNETTDEIACDNTALNIQEEFSDNFFDTSRSDVKEILQKASKDTFFDTDDTENVQDEETNDKDDFHDPLYEGREKKASLIQDALRTKDASEKALQDKVSTPSTQKTQDIIQNSLEVTSDNMLEQNTSIDTKETTESQTYPAILDIRKIFVQMKKRYKPIEKTYERFPTVETLLTVIEEKGYEEKKIEETLQYIEKLIKKRHFLQAAQLLLISASTESKFAQLILARELYKGVIFVKDSKESFTLLTGLANQNHPESLCDLGQFYEHGIDTEKDEKQAITLYKKSMDLGIKRAEKHFERLNKKPL